MATSAVPLVIDALLALGRSDAVPSVPAALVLDGLAVTLEPGNYLMVGAEDPDTDGAAFSAEVRQDWAAMGPYAPRDEGGDVTCVALAWNGDGDQKAARDAVYDIVNELADACRANVTLGIDQLLWASLGTTGQLSQAQGENGASAYLIFRIHFEARI